MSPHLLESIILSVAEYIETNRDMLTDLDRAIGDGDHGVNMKRGLDGVLKELPGLLKSPLPETIDKIGTTLVMSIGGASGPLYGSLFIAMAKHTVAQPINMEQLSFSFAKGINAVQKRGKSTAGQKTLLDVLVPVAKSLSEAVEKGTPVLEALAMIKIAADQGLEATRNMVAQKGRAAFLGKRSVGHIDPGAQSSQLMIRAICSVLERHIYGQQEKPKNMQCVGMVIVSHSPDIAKGTAEMVRQVVGDVVPMAYCGGNPDKGLGTDVAAIKLCIENVYSEAGVVVLVDLGGAETNSEMAIEMLPEKHQSKVIICNGPIVEGAVMAATESAGGGRLHEVCAIAEEFYLDSLAQLRKEPAS
jgi:phosphoenolpyruvate---glycerone phosphotransferase subunit DhaL